VRSDENILRLLDFVQREYGISAAIFTPAERGFYGETWRLDEVGDSGESYFLKLVYAVEHKDTYMHSFPVIEYLCDHGIDFVGRVVKTKYGKLYAKFDGAILGIFHWINGDLTESDETKIPEYQMLAKVYTVPTSSLDIPREDFLGSSGHIFFTRWSNFDSSYEENLINLFDKYRSKLEHRGKRLKHFAALCSADAGEYFITHGDAGGNLIVDGEKYHIVDWDTAILAPPERDAWVMCSKDWAREAFENALHQKGINHALRPEHMAYYCYYFFFYYLNAFLDASSSADIIEEYINGWIEDSIRYCDEL